MFSVSRLQFLWTSPVWHFVIPHGCISGLVQKGRYVEHSGINSVLRVCLTCGKEYILKDLNTSFI